MTSLLESLPHLATAKKRAFTAGALGGVSDTPTTVFTDRPCWVQPARSSTITEYQKRGLQITNKVFFAVFPDLDETHILEISGETYEVVGADDAFGEGGRGVLFKVMVKRTTTGSTP